MPSLSYNLDVFCPRWLASGLSSSVSLNVWKLPEVQGSKCLVFWTISLWLIFFFCTNLLHRIIGSLGIIHSIPLSLTWVPLTRLSTSKSHPSWSWTLPGTPTVSQSNIFQFLTILKRENFYSISNLNPLVCNSLPFTLSLQYLIKSHSPSLAGLYWKVLHGLPRASSSPGLWWASAGQMPGHLWKLFIHFPLL